MNAASFCKGQPNITNFGGWDGTYWAKGQPQPTLSSITIVSGSAPLATTATVTASGVVVRHSATTIVATGTITRAVGERIPANLLVISTPNAQVTARGSYYTRGRTNFNAATASVFARGFSIRSSPVSMTGTATALLIGRTTVVNTTSMTGTAALDATAHWITRGQASLTAQGLLTGTTGHRITGTSVLMQGVATFFATPPAVTGVRITHQTRALLRTSFTKTQTTAALLSVQRSQSHTTTALLKAAQTKAQTTNALLKATGTLAATTNALLKATGSINHRTRALLKKSQTKAHTTRALLKATYTRTTSTDALLRGTYSRTQTTNALVWKQQSLVHSTAASIIPDPGEQHHTDARLYGLVSLSHGTNARLLIEFTGSGVLELPSLRLTGAGVINHYYPSKSELVLPKFQVQGKGTFTRPEIVPETPSDVFYRNRRYLEFAYGWGRRDLFEVFNWNPCRCVTAPEQTNPIVAAARVDPAFEEFDRQRVLRAAFRAAERRQARKADPNYQEPVWGLPEAKKGPEEPLIEVQARPYSVEPRRAPLAQMPGKVKLLPAMVAETIEIEVVRPPQPVIVVEIHTAPAEVPAPERLRENFHVEPPRPKLHHEAGGILVMAAAPAPVAPPMPVFVPPQEVVRVDKPVAVLEPPPSLLESRGRGFSVGPRTRKRKH